MERVYVRGMGLTCALGMDLDAALIALRDGRIAAQPLNLDEFEESLRMPYYRIPDGRGLFEAARLEHLLPGVVRTAVAQAGLSMEDQRRLPLFIGSSCFSIAASENIYTEALQQHPASALPMPLCGYQDIAALVARTLGGAGERWSYNTACTSSANAVLGALRVIRQGWYRHALVIGVELANYTTLTGFSGLQIVAERLRPFDVARTGLVLGEGIGAVLLSAERGDENPPRLLGGASNCDTYSTTTANPDGNSVAAVLRAALTRTGVQPRDVCGIKAHGTATPGSDLAEARGMRQVFPDLPPVSALKSCVGHTLGACGAIELALFAGALQRSFQPATPGFATLDPELGIAPLRQQGDAPEGVYLLNQFGFGGNNTVLVLEKTTP